MFRIIRFFLELDIQGIFADLFVLGLRPIHPPVGPLVDIDSWTRHGFHLPIKVSRPISPSMSPGWFRPGNSSRFSFPGSPHPLRGTCCCAWICCKTGPNHLGETMQYRLYTHTDCNPAYARMRMGPRASLPCKTRNEQGRIFQTRLDKATRLRNISPCAELTMHVGTWSYGM